MRVVVDTNVLISAALRDKTPQTVILFIASRPDVEWVVTSSILTEYKEVLSRDKFHLPAAILQRWFELLDAFTVVIEPSITVDFPRDQKDAKFLACALVCDVI